MDYGAAVSMLERAASFVPRDQIDVRLETDLVDALVWAGRGDEALRHADSLSERASAIGDRVAEWCGRIQAGIYRVYFDPEETADQLAALTQQALAVFEAARHDLGLYLGYSALGHATRGRRDAALDAFERAFAHARQAGLPYHLLPGRAGTRLQGTTSVSDLLAWLDKQEAAGMRSHYLRRTRAKALAMLGRFDEARTILQEVRAESADRGGELSLAMTALDSAEVELRASDPAAALAFGEEGSKRFGELGEKAIVVNTVLQRAQALYALDRLDEARAWAGRAAKLGANDEPFTQMLWRQVRAKVLARRGENAEAERLAREAVAIGEKTDMLSEQGDAYADLAEVLAVADRPNDSAEALEQALACYQRKENVVMSERVRARLAELQSSGTAAERA
jgi:tetratricopeptide (TPR) repeat protein